MLAAVISLDSQNVFIKKTFSYFYQKLLSILLNNALKRH